MKLKKRISALCAVAMLLSVFASAGAVSPAAAEPLSENAGTYVTYQVIQADPSSDTVETRIAEVFIPADATRAEEEAIVRATAFGSSAASTFSTTDGPFIELSYMTDIPYMMDYFEVNVGGGTLDATYPTLTVNFENLYPGNGATLLYVRLHNVTKNLSWTKSITLGTVTDWTFFMYSDDSTLRMEKENTLQVYAYTNAGYAEADSCTVYVSPYDMG